MALPQPSPVIQALQAAGVRSYVVAPLIAHGALIGALGLGSESPGAFGAEHTDIAREVADQVAVALHQARLRADLEAGRQRLEALVEHLPEGILLLDTERRILLANPVAEGYLASLTDTRPGEVLSRLANRSLEELLTSPPGGLWHELESSGPPPQLFEALVRPVVESKSQSSGWVLTMRDVTEERRAQEHIQRQERLAAVGQLASGIAHDFNNLLTTIMLYAQIGLRKEDISPDLAQSFETILGESRQAAKLVQQILDFSRRSPIETHPVDLKLFVKEVVRILERTIPENISFLLEVETEGYEDPFTVNADPTRIQQVLMNLVVNARDAMPEGGVLRIGLSRADFGAGEEPPATETLPTELPDGKWVCLSVSDTGVGIPPEVKSHIFEPFFTTKPPGKGTGLGLPQVYGIVTQHKGYIDVETEVDEWTVFRVYLPAYRAEKEISPEEVTPVVPKGKGEIILLAEDNEGIREATQEILESLGYRVLTAADGEEALAVFQAEGEVDLLLTDVVMPEVGGRELARELRRVAPGLKVIAMTGHPLKEELETLKKEDIQEVVRKPLDMDVLTEALHRVLNQEK